MEESGERVVDERLRAIDKRTGKYVTNMSLIQESV